MFEMGVTILRGDFLVSNYIMGVIFEISIKNGTEILAYDPDLTKL